MILQAGLHINIPHWDLIIAHPPCTYLSNAATGMHSVAKTPENRIEGRTFERIKAMEFFMQMITANCEHIAVENPVGIMNTAFRKPDQIIEPYQFADSEKDTENYVTKRTCLWLKNLPQLKTNNLCRPNNKEIFGTIQSGKNKGKALNMNDCHGKTGIYKCWEDHIRDSVLRSKTFPGIARAFAEQWGDYLYGDD